MPITVDGHFVAMLSPEQSAALEKQQHQRKLTAANLELGPFVKNPASIANSPSGRAHAVVTSLYQTTEGLMRALPAAASVRDDSLSPAGLQAERTSRVEYLIEAVKVRVENSMRSIEDALRVADTAAAKHRPTFDPENFAQVTRTDQAWNNSIKPQLEAGKSWDQIIPTLDYDGLLAAKRFAPAHEAGTRGRRDQEQVPSVLAGMEALIEARIIGAAPSENARAAFVEARETAKYAAAARTIADLLLSVDGIRNLSTVSIAAKRVAFQVGAQSLPVSPAA